MPKLIDPYRKSSIAYDEASIGRPSLGIVAILIVLALFGLSVGSDAYREMAETSKKIEDQSKLCVIEFGQQNCDALKLSSKC